MEHVENAARDLVRPGEDRVDIGRALQDHPRRAPAPRLRPGAEPHLIAGQLEPLLGQPLQRALGAVLRRAVRLVAGDVRDLAPPVPDQVVDGQPSAAHVVGHEREVARVVRGGVGVDHRHRQVPSERGPRVGSRSHHDQPVHPARQKRT